MKYLVQYGVNNSHITEFDFFEKYSKAKKFYEGLSKDFQSKLCCKVTFSNRENELGEFLSKKECKLFRFENGTDNNLMLEILGVEYVRN